MADFVDIRRGRRVVASPWQRWIGVLLTFVACTVALRAETDLISRQSSWRYLDTGVNLSTGWRTSTYDDGAWPTGSGQFGFGDGDEATVVSFGTRPDLKYITTYFRTHFVVSDPAIYPALTLSVLRDDGVAVYLNGTRIFLSNLASPYSYTTRATASIEGAAESAYLVQPVSPSLLMTGTNVLAAEVHLFSRVDTDMSFDAGLTAGSTNPVKLVVASAWGDPTPPRGTNLFVEGETVVCSVSPSTVTASGGTTQYVCTGWTGTGVTPGTGTSATVHLAGDTALTWLWATNVWLSGASSKGGWAFGANRWWRLGDTSRVEAAAFNHYRFGGWSGDVPTNQTSENPLALAMDRTRAIRAAFEVGNGEDGRMATPRLSLSGPGTPGYFQVETNRALLGLHRDNMSGCCLMPSTGELLVILNRTTTSPFAPAIQVYSPSGTYLRAISLTGFDDTEGLCAYKPASNLFAILEEGRSDISIVTITSNTTSIAKSSATVIAMNRPYTDNNAWEGVTYDPVNNAFFVVKERVPMGVSRVYRVDGGGYASEEVFNAAAAFSGLCTDLSDVRYDGDSGRLWILSDEGKRVMECDLAGHVWSSFTLNASQPEGLEFSPDLRTLYVVGESNEYFRCVRLPTRSDVAEGGGIDLTATLSWPWTGTVSTAYQAAGGMAVAGQDFAPATGRLDFAAGVTSATFRVDVPVDDETEPAESFSVALCAPSNALLGVDATHSATIQANTSVTLVVRSALGHVIPPEGTHRFNAGTSVECSVTGTPMLAESGSTQFTCHGWIGEGSVPAQGVGTHTPDVVLNTNSVIEWRWSTNVYMTFGTHGSGSVDVAQGWYRLGTGIVATATADPFHHFEEWTGDTPGGTDPMNHVLSVTADAPRAIDAEFRENLAAFDTPEWWLSRYGVTGDFDNAAEDDADGDRAAAWQEYRAGTDPTRSNSVLRITGLGLASDGSALITWSGGSNRTYRAERSDGISEGPMSVVTGNIPSAASGIVTDASAQSRTGAFYRMAVEWPPP
jgi:uncharacterized protein YjiK